MGGVKPGQKEWFAGGKSPVGAYAVLTEAFERAQVPALEDIAGWYVGRALYERGPGKFRPAVLMGGGLQGGPLKVLMQVRLDKPQDYFDALAAGAGERSEGIARSLRDYFRAEYPGLRPPWFTQREAEAYCHDGGGIGAPRLVSLAIRKLGRFLIVRRTEYLGNPYPNEEIESYSYFLRKVREGGDD